MDDVGREGWTRQLRPPRCTFWGCARARETERHALCCVCATRRHRRATRVALIVWCVERPRCKTSMRREMRMRDMLTSCGPSSRAALCTHHTRTHGEDTGHKSQSLSTTAHSRPRQWSSLYSPSSNPCRPATASLSSCFPCSPMPSLPWSQSFDNVVLERGAPRRAPPPRRRECRSR